MGILCIGLGILIFFHRPEKVTSNLKEEIPKATPILYDTLEKKAKSITVRPSTKAELKFISLRMKPAKSEGSNQYTRENRLLMGDDVERFSDSNVYLPTLNKPSKDWKEKLGHELLRFQGEGVKVALAHEQSYIEIVRGKGRYVELVVVNYINPTGGNRAYRALADSETGAIIDTWDRTEVEHKKPFIFTQH